METSDFTMIALLLDEYKMFEVSIEADLYFWVPNYSEQVLLKRRFSAVILHFIIQLN